LCKTNNLVSISSWVKFLINGEKMAENVMEFNDQNFDSDVLKAGMPVLVDFWAVWCGPCKAIAPIVEEVANEFSGKVRVGKMDVDSNNQVAMRYGIRSIPTLLLFSGGEVVDQVIGNVGKESIESMLSKAI
jgi:thioredoxin 1